MWHLGVRPATFGSVLLPLLAWALPSVAQRPQILPNSVREGSAGFSLQVQAAGIGDTSVVRWNGSDRQTTYSIVNGVPTLAVQISSLDVAEWGEGKVTIVTPGSPESAPAFFAIYSTLGYVANDMVYEPFSRILFASTTAASPSSPDSLVALNPTVLIQQA